MSDLSALFTDAATRHNVPVEFLQRTAQIESSMNPNARNPRSSAGGLFQFIDSTAQQYGLQNKFDPAQATDAAARLAADNARSLQSTLGRNPTAAELYLAHQQGPAGAAKLLTNPTAPAASLVGAKAVTLNGGRPDMTASDFANLWLGKFGKTGPAMGGKLPAFAQAGVPQPMAIQEMQQAPQVNPVAQFALAQMFQQQQQAELERQMAEQRQAEVARRRALFG